VFAIDKHRMHMYQKSNKLFVLKMPHLYFTHFIICISEVILKIRLKCLIFFALRKKWWPLKGPL